MRQLRCAFARARRVRGVQNNRHTAARVRSHLCVAGPALTAIIIALPRFTHPPTARRVNAARFASPAKLLRTRPSRPLCAQHYSPPRSRLAPSTIHMALRHATLPAARSSDATPPGLARKMLAPHSTRSRLSWARARSAHVSADDALLLPESSSPVTSEGRSRSSSARAAQRCSSFASAARTPPSPRRVRAWDADDSPLSSDALEADLARKSSLPRCAVVHFRREGDVVRWTPRARENTGGMAARTRDFDDAFQLEELSSRTFAFGRRRASRAYHEAPAVERAAEALDVGVTLAAAAAAGLAAPPPPSPRGRLRRFAALLRRRVAQPPPRQRHTAPAASEDHLARLRAHASAHVEPTARRSLSTGDIRAMRSGCIPSQLMPSNPTDRACTTRPRRTLQLLFRRRANTSLVDAFPQRSTAPSQAPGLQRTTRDSRKISSLSSWNLRRSSAPTACNPSCPSLRANDPYVQFMDTPQRR